MSTRRAPVELRQLAAVPDCGDFICEGVEDATFCPIDRAEIADSDPAVAGGCGVTTNAAPSPSALL